MAAVENESDQSGGTPSTDGHRDESLLALGERIRQARRDRKMTLQDLASATGLSVSMLSLVERGKTSPSIGSLVVVASALQTPVAELVAGIDQRRDGNIIRKRDQPVVSPWPGASRRTAKLDRQRQIEISMNEWEPSSEAEPQPARHEGYEYGLVIDGELTLDLGGSTHVLGAGDLISYPSTTLHRLRNTSNETTRAVWINVGGFSDLADRSDRGDSDA